MNGKKLWTVSMVAVALTLFSSLAFAQNHKDTPGGATARAAAAMTALVDAVAVRAGGLSSDIFTDLENSSLSCEGQEASYYAALDSVNVAWEHIGNAYVNVRAFAKTGNRAYSVAFYAELAEAIKFLAIASQNWFEAKDKTC